MQKNPSDRRVRIWPWCFGFPNGKNNLSCGASCAEYFGCNFLSALRSIFCVCRLRALIFFCFFAHFYPSFRAHVSSSDISPFFLGEMSEGKSKKKKKKMYYSCQRIAVGKSKNSIIQQGLYCILSASAWLRCFGAFHFNAVESARRARRKPSQPR